MLARKIKVRLLSLFLILLFSRLAFGEHMVLIDGTATYFEYRRTITIQSGQVVGGPHGNFPMLFDSTKVNSGLQDDLRTQGYSGKVRNANGDDIVFATGNGVEILKHEIEYYDEEFGDYVAWVRVESIDNGTAIYLYYGSDDSITYPANFATDVWDINFKLVHHLEETDIDGGFEDIKDSTSYGNHGTTQGMISAAQVDGQIDGSFAFDGSNDEVEFGSDPTYTFDASETYTYEIWFNFDPTQPDTYPNIWSDENDTASSGLDFYLESNSVRLYCNTAGSDVVNSGTLTGNVWYYAAITYDNGACELFIDDSSVDTGSQTFNDSTGTFELGVYDDESMFLEGKLDEVRISDIVRGDGWIRTSYNNQYSPASFYSISGPTLVELSYFRAKGLNSAVLLEWATETELDNEGFNVLRSEDKSGKYVQINPYFIPAEGEAGFGAEYNYTDYDVQNGKIYYYKLEEIDIYGKSTFHGPVPAILNDIIPIWPPDKIVLPSDYALFSWANSGNYSFKVEVSPNPSFSASETLSFPENRWISSHSIWLTPSEWEIVLRKAQESSGQLFWRIRAKSEDGRLVCSDWRRFVIEGNGLPEE